MVDDDWLRAGPRRGGYDADSCRRRCRGALRRDLKVGVLFDGLNREWHSRVDLAEVGPLWNAWDMPIDDSVWTS